MQVQAALAAHMAATLASPHERKEEKHYLHINRRQATRDSFSAMSDGVFSFTEDSTLNGFVSWLSILRLGLMLPGTFTDGEGG